MTDARLEVSGDKATLTAQVADWIVERYEAQTGRFALNLSGGSTPKALYERLATEVYRRKFDWTRVHLFFGDERFVPHDHPDSNYRMVHEAMISRVPIPAENVHAVETAHGSPEEAAAAYEATLKRYYGKTTLDMERPIFSVTLLGLGEDGHTASLFPGTPTLRERSRWVTSIVGARPEPRITMTFPVLESSAETAFLVAGDGKRAMLKRLLARDTALPAALVKPIGELVVFCDAAAHGEIPG